MVARKLTVALLSLSLVCGTLSASAACDATLPADWVHTALGLPWSGSTSLWSFVRVFRKQKMVLCTVPGAGSTLVRTFINAIAVSLSGGEINMSQTTPHAEMREAWWLTPLETMTRKQVQEIACDPSWTKLAFVRNPYARLLSKFEDKIVRHGKDMKPGGEAYKEFRIPAQRADGLNFTHFTARLAGVAGLTTDVLDGHSHHIRRRQPVMNKPHSESEYVDEHFRVMSNFCGMRYIPYEWIRYEDPVPGMNRIANQMGVSQHPDVAQQIAKFRPRSACDEALRLGRSYSEVDKTRVREYFAEDFKRFGYSDAFPTCDEPPHPR